MALRVVIVLIVIAIALHTASYGLWALRQGNQRGGIGAFVLAGAAVAAPVVVWVIAS